MQNVDFYSGKINKNIPPQFNTQDPEYFTRMAYTHKKDEEKSHKRVSRMLSFIIALCIISFTTGLVVGIKFGSGSKKEIMDESTRKAVSDIGQKVTSLIKEKPKKTGADAAKDSGRFFPKNEFPFVIRVGRGLDKGESQKIAGYLSGKGHTVIISKYKQNFNLYTGPYENMASANSSLEKMKDYSNKEWFSDARVLQR